MDGILSEIDKYKWVESQKKGRDIGCYSASTEWFGTEYKKWFNKIVPALKPIFQRGSENEKDIAKLFLYFGGKIKRIGPNEFYDIVKDQRESIPWGRTIDLSRYLDNGSNSESRRFKKQPYYQPVHEAHP